MTLILHGQKQKKNYYLFSHSGEQKNKLKSSFLDAYTRTYLLFFCICVIIYYPNPRVESIWYVVNENTSFVTSEIGVLCPKILND